MKEDERQSELALRVSPAQLFWTFGSSPEDGRRTVVRRYRKRTHFEFVIFSNSLTLIARRYKYLSDFLLLYKPRKNLPERKRNEIVNQAAHWSDLFMALVVVLSLSSLCRDLRMKEDDE